MDVGALFSDWWDEINESSQWQDGIFYTLCAAYALVSSVALVSLSLSLSISLGVLCIRLFLILYSGHSVIVRSKFLPVFVVSDLLCISSAFFSLHFVVD